MAKKPPEDEKEAERRFNETLGRMLGTPHKPHAPLSKEQVTDSKHSKRKGRS
jgi:hypothetical protein